MSFHWLSLIFFIRGMSAIERNSNDSQKALNVVFKPKSMSNPFPKIIKLSIFLFNYQIQIYSRLRGRDVWYGVFRTSVSRCLSAHGRSR